MKDIISEIGQSELGVVDLNIMNELLSRTKRSGAARWTRATLAGSLLLLSACGGISQAAQSKDGGGTGNVPNSPTFSVLTATPTETPTVVLTRTPSATETRQPSSTSTVAATETPRPSSTSTAVATETPRPSTTPGAAIDHPLGRNECFKPNVESITEGDIVVEGTRLFGDDEKTGNITQAQAENNICGPFGADIHLSGSDINVKARIVGGAIEGMLEKGCVGGCDEVIDRLWPVKSINESGLNPQPVLASIPDTDDKELKKDECYTLYTTSIIEGDVKVGGVAKYDSDDRTGLVIQAPAGKVICAPFNGADIHSVGNDQPTLRQVMGAVVENMKLVGCKLQQGCYRGVKILKIK